MRGVTHLRSHCPGKCPMVGDLTQAWEFYFWRNFLTPSYTPSSHCEFSPNFLRDQGRLGGVGGCRARSLPNPHLSHRVQGLPGKG